MSKSNLGFAIFVLGCLGPYAAALAEAHLRPDARSTGHEPVRNSASDRRANVEAGPDFESKGTGRAEIETLLHTYTRAVSEKNQPLFESILISTDIPFSDVSTATKPGRGSTNTRNYASFREGVFHGPPFKQTFRDVHIDQDGDVAQVSLVYINSSRGGQDWGWKTMQLLKVSGHWKIASEFFSGHASRIADVD